MTCIVAVATDKSAFIGGDSAGVAGYSLVQRADQKVFRNGDYLFGFTSSFRMGQLLQYRFEPPRRHPDDDLLKFMSTEFVDEVRSCFKKYGWTKVEHSVESGGTFLVVVERRIFEIEDDFQVGESLHPYAAVGCGDHLALGALCAMHHEAGKRLDGHTMVQRALEAAETFSAGVRRPFNIIEADHG